MESSVSLIKKLACSPRVDIACGMLLALAWGAFAFSHLNAYQASGQWTYVLFFISETFTACMFLCRSSAATVSSDWVDWALAILATMGPLLLHPNTTNLFPEAKYAILVGILIQIAGMLSLNRSFGIVAARRKIKTAGMYRFVRHPLYASYLLINTGYVLTNTSAWNIAVCSATFILLYFRLLREERHLAQSPDYRAYMKQVRYRVVPFIL